MRVVVTGGLGALGSQVVTHLRELGHEPVVASRRTGVDLESGSGLDAVLDEADAVVHTADTTSARRFEAVTVGGTRAVLEAAGRQTTPPHVVTISIVHCEQVPYVYYRAKRRADEATLGSGLPATVVRATQFHSLAAYFARVGRVGPVAVGIRGMRIQPVDISWVGQRLAEIAVGPRPEGAGTGPDLTGPEIFDARQILTRVSAHEGRSVPRLLELPAVGGAMRAFADGAILAGPDAEVGGQGFDAWLAAQPARLTGR